jgi:hypothetical protein
MGRFDCMLFVFLYAYCCPTRFPYQMIIMSFNNDTTGVTRGAATRVQPRFLVVFVLLNLSVLSIVLSTIV